MEAGFGTSGLRGPAQELLGGAARSYVLAFARFLQARCADTAPSPVFLGHDRRQSSPALLAICAAALRESGFRAINLGALPTPSLAALAMKRGAPSIMVTGSHIPADRNGLKFYLPEGEITKKDETEIASRLPSSESHVPPPPAPELDRAMRLAALHEYAARYEGLIRDRSFERMRVAVYDHSSIATNIIARLLRRGGASVSRFGSARRFIPVDTEALEDKALNHFSRIASEHAVDAIVSTDADGDRPLLTDERGRPLPGDLLGWTCARLLEADAVATPLTSNSGIAGSDAVQVLRTKVGSPFVIAGMETLLAGGANLPVGFEANGGFLLGRNTSLNGHVIPALPTRDAVLPLLAALLYARRNAIPLSDLAANQGFKGRSGGRIGDFPATVSARLLRRLAEDSVFRQEFLRPLGAPVSLDLLDGVRIGLDNGAIVHLRASGNAPELRIYCEAPDDRQAANAVKLLMGRVRAYTL